MVPVPHHDYITSMLILYLLKNMILGPVITLQETNQREGSLEHHRRSLGRPNSERLRPVSLFNNLALDLRNFEIFFWEPKFVNITKKSSFMNLVG